MFGSVMAWEEKVDAYIETLRASVHPLLLEEFYGNSLLRLIIALSVSLLLGVVFVVGARVFRIQLRRLSRRTPIVWDEPVVRMVEETKSFLVAVAALALGLGLLRMSEPIDTWRTRIVLLTVLVQLGLYGRRLFFELLKLWARRQEDPPNTLLAAFRFVGSFVIWSLILMFGLSAVGIEISALLAGLGVGGVAAALAAQSILGDAFSAVSIYSDRPFDIGDFVSFGEDRGWVTGIGWRTTRLKSLGGELLVVPNSDMSGSRVHNFGKMERRRIAFDTGVIYGTSTEHMKAIPDFIKEVIDQTELATFDRSHFKGFGDFSLNFETVFFVEAKEYGTYMEVQHHVMMGILEKLRSEGIEIAFPTRSLYLEGQPSLRVESIAAS